MIKLIDINKYYSSQQGKFHALKNINVTFPDQGMVYIVGKSGSGKSTLLNVIGGIDKYDSGKLIIENAVLDDNTTSYTINTVDTSDFTRKDFNSYRNTYIGFIFQEFNVIKGLTVYENIALSLELQKKSVIENNDKILEIINKVGLLGKENRRINELSGGERQRVAIARALIKDPKVIIADEPTGNLDSKNRDIVMNILKELSKEKLVIIVTHDKHLSKRYGDREIKIKDGEIVSDEVLNAENVQNIVPTKHKIEPISPKAIVSLNLAWKGFKLNKARFIFIIILFSISLIFAGSVINLYLTDTTKEYAKFQDDYGNYVVTISDKYNYHNEISTSAFFSVDYDDNIEVFSIDENTSMLTYKNMNINIPIDQNLKDKENLYPLFGTSINNITVFDDTTHLKKGFNIDTNLVDYAAGRNNYSCYITDYLVYNLIDTNYYGSSVTKPEHIIGRTIDVPGMVNDLVIEGVIKTNYSTFKPDNSEQSLAAFADNLAVYNSIFVSAEKFKNIFSASNIEYYYDDIVIYDNDKTEKFTNVKYSKITNSVKLLSGNIPAKPLKGEITQVAVSKGFIEQVLKINPNAAKFVSSSGTTKLAISSDFPHNFYVCGVNHIPTQTEFNITGIVDTEEIIIYAPRTNESTLFSNWISTAFIDGGFITALIDDDIETNSKIYRNLLDNGVSINNPSFKKLQLVDDFIGNNIFLFAALFFVFCLFSTLMIFNFIIINIKNSTRDIGIYMSLGMNGLKISLIYLFQVLIISSIAMVIGIIGSTILLKVIDMSFAKFVIVDFKILHNTFLGISGIILLAYLTPIIAIASPLFSLSRKKPIDVIKVS